MSFIVHIRQMVEQQQLAGELRARRSQAFLGRAPVTRRRDTSVPPVEVLSAMDVRLGLQSRPQPRA